MTKELMMEDLVKRSSEESAGQPVQKPTWHEVGDTGYITSGRSIGLQST